MFDLYYFNYFFYFRNWEHGKKENLKVIGMLNPRIQEARDSDTIEGSGSEYGARGLNKNVVAADIDWEASGVGPDDEDGDVIEGSGSPPLNQKHDAVEGSGLPSVPKKPVITPDDPFPKKQEKEVEEQEEPKTTTGAATTLPPVATTLITINKADTKVSDLITEIKIEITRFLKCQI